jgi:hypothetical protein
MATQSEELGHETLSRLVSRSTCVAFQVDGPPAGSREVIASPSLSPATHSDADAHDTAVRFATQSSPGPYFPHSGGVEVPTVSVLQAPAPTVGSVEVATSPAGPTATQSDRDGHEIAENPDTPTPSCVVRQAPRPPAGLVEVRTVPAVLTAAQNDDDGQDTPVSDPDET